ncbi:NAC domain-containing protein [Canna indica]|uniref:NAC domain-containing protein n=1 Tax=Canna indica TaxID=4628 RepID=A0AAQ3KXP6_9LILI|nr:NAC domain-containing protein [Canna indica]
MSAVSLPPGFRFRPTDDELVGYYLKRKVDGLSIELEIIPVIELYKYDPWELPDKSFLPKRDMEWFFFCPRDRKYPNGLRVNRATTSGYWKATGKDRKISCDQSVFGLRKTLVFYCGRAPGGDRTEWVMYEYRLCQDLYQGTSNYVGAFALCHVVKRNYHSPKTGQMQGEPKAKGSSSSAFEFDSKGYFDNVPSSLEVNSSVVTEVYDKNGGSTPFSSPYTGGEFVPESFSVDCDERSICRSEMIVNASFSVDCDERSICRSEMVVNASESITGNSTVSEAYPPSELSPSYVNFTVEEFMLDDFPGAGISPSFAVPAHSLGLYSNAEDITVQSFHLNGLRYLDTSYNGNTTY